MGFEQGGVFVVEDEFDFVVLVGLEIGRLVQVWVDGVVFGWCYGGQYCLGVYQLVEDL